MAHPLEVANDGLGPSWAPAYGFSTGLPAHLQTPAPHPLVRRHVAESMRNRAVPAKGQAP